MKHSFIEPRQKKLFGAELKWLLGISILLVVVMLGSTLLLNSAISTHHTDLNQLKAKSEALKSEQSKLVVESKRLEHLASIAEEITTKNRIKKENVKNFFDLVPDDVVLQKAEFREGILHLKGSTQSITRFKRGFERSLKSLFVRSSTQFKKVKKGGYTFTNISIVEQK